MEISLSSQIFALIYSVAVGAFLGLSYDVIRITRVLAGLRITRTSSGLEEKTLPLIGKAHRGENKKSGAFASVFVFIGDIMYSLYASAVFCVFVFHANQGYGRWFLVAGCAVGFAVYLLTAGRLVMAFSGVIAFVIRCALRYLVYFLCLPFRLAGVYLVRPLRREYSKLLGRYRTERFEKRLERELMFEPDG